MSEQDEKPIQIQWGKQEVALAKAALGILPFGSVFSELLTEFIPMQRRERIDQYLHFLSEKLNGMDEADFSNKLKNPEAVDLFEEGGFQSARAVSADRKEYIAKAVAKGLSGDEVATLQAKRMLDILEALDDDQIIRLASYLHKNHFDDDFFKKHKSVLEAPSVHMQSSQAEIEAGALYDSARASLVAHGLLKASYKAPRTGEAPAFNENTGTLKAGPMSLTVLGRMLLSHIGLGEDDDAEDEDLD